MPSSGLLTLYHPALDAGSSPVWIPVFTGMTHPLSSSTESEALRIGDPVLPGFPFSREWQRGDAGSSPAWIPVFTGMTHSLSSPAWLGIQLVWISVFTKMTKRKCYISRVNSNLLWALFQFSIIDHIWQLARPDSARQLLCILPE